MTSRIAIAILTLTLVACATNRSACPQISASSSLRGTGDLGVVIERTTGSLLIVDTSAKQALARVTGLGDLSHASVVFARDTRYAYVFGRDGGLSRIDLLTFSIANRIVQSGNSIGGAISQDGRVIAVSNYEPGGVKLFDATTLDLLANVPAISADGRASKTVGLIDLPGHRFAFALFEAGEIWLLDARNPRQPQVTRFPDAGRQPYDALVTPDGRFYVVGLFGEDGMAMLDLWNEQPTLTRILSGYGRGEKPLPVYKMPHLEGWGQTSRLSLVPAVGRHEVLVVDNERWVETGRIAVAGQPVFIVMRPDGRQAWVNFAFPDFSKVQIIDVPMRRLIDTLIPGKGVMHLEFTPRGEHVWLSVRDEDQVRVYDAENRRPIAAIPARSPSGIFFTMRAHRIGM